MFFPDTRSVTRSTSAVAESERGVESASKKNDFMGTCAYATCATDDPRRGSWLPSCGVASTTVERLLDSMAAPKSLAAVVLANQASAMSAGERRRLEHAVGRWPQDGCLDTLGRAMKPKAMTKQGSAAACAGDDQFVCRFSVCCRHVAACLREHLLEDGKTLQQRRQVAELVRVLEPVRQPKGHGMLVEQSHGDVDRVVVGRTECV